ncbi:MAG TPA: tetratricopeptide repeat protein [Polyangia bacterium]|nr:tetratricopeptide repeat protein [Polyangia bacterium]
MIRAAVVDWALRAALATLLVSATACQHQAAAPPPAQAQAPDAGQAPKTAAAAATTTTSVATTTNPAAAPEPPTRPLRRCFPQRPAWDDAPVGDLLDRAADLFDTGDYEGALVCAEEAARQAPRSVEAHHNRAIALLHLERVDEARDALALALALAPDDPETLEAAADLFVNQLPPSADRSLLGLEYARRGSRHTPARDAGRRARLALLEGQALIDLGRANEALRRLDASLAYQPDVASALYERGVALFELCRFDDAHRMFEKVLADEDDSDHPHALYHLGLIEERQGDEGASALHLAAATAADPKAFPAPPKISQADFAARVRRAVEALDPDMRRDLASISVEAADIPSSEDLTAEKPPLSPTILGLFRGLPLDWNAREPLPTQAGRPSKKGRAEQPDQSEPSKQSKSDGAPTPRCDSAGVPERAIVLYRRNLLRTVQTPAELDEAITRTLLHEVGHLRGEDDGSLRDRGLE